MKNILTMKSWSPHGVGAAIGVLSGFTFLTVDHAPGITTAFEPTVAIAEREILPEVAAKNLFFEQKTPTINWGWMLVVGVFIGAYISSTLSGDHDAGEVTLPELTGTSPWLWILGLTAAAAAIGLTRKSGLSSPASANHAQHTS